jgi:hypothetical protein
VEKNFFIGEKDFRVWLPDVQFIEKSEEVYNSRKISGVMTSQRKDRQGEDVVAKGLDFNDFLSYGHFNDNHSQDTSAIVGYPEEVKYHEDLGKVRKDLGGVEGWGCKGYVLKGYSRADNIWELAKALQSTPDKRLGFSIEGKVLRRNNKTIEKASIRNVAITNCPVNTDARWEIFTKSFVDSDSAIKAMAAGYGVSPSTQTGGGALRPESLDSDVKRVMDDRKKKLKKAFEFDSLLKSMEYALELRPDLSDEAAAYLVCELYKRGGKL